METIIHHYSSPRAADEAVAALHAAGIGAEHIGFLTREGVQGHFHLPSEENPDDMQGREGATLGALAGLVTAALAMATPLGPLIAVGPLFGALVGALAGAATGGAVASLVETGMSADEAHRLAATLENEQAVLLSVEVPTERAEEVQLLLARVQTTQQGVEAHGGAPWGAGEQEERGMGGARVFGE